MSSNNIIFSALIIGLSFVIGMLIFTQTWRSNYDRTQTITVTGSASLVFTSDYGIISGTITQRDSDPMKAFAGLQEATSILNQFLIQNGASADDIEFDTIRSWTWDEYDDTGRPTGRVLNYTYSQSFSLLSDDVNFIRDLSQTLPSLVNQGVQISVDSPQYHFSDLDEMRIRIQGLAAANAKVRAEEIISATGQRIGSLTGSRVGVLQITPVHSVNVSDYGINDLSSIEKKITGVVNATFRIH